MLAQKTKRNVESIKTLSNNRAITRATSFQNSNYNYFVLFAIY